jgi:hypothetical protein
MIELHVDGWRALAPALGVILAPCLLLAALALVVRWMGR